jgi:hypothetical protein
VETVGRHAPPALGQVPEQREQPAVDAVELGDRLHQRDPLRTLGQPVDQHRVDLRVLGQRQREPAVEHAERGSLQRRPADLVWHEPLGAAGLPGPDEVARAEQLARHVVRQRQLARHQTVEDQQPDVLGPGLAQPLPVPGARLDDVAADQQLPARLLDLLGAHEPREVRLGVE